MGLFDKFKGKNQTNNNAYNQNTPALSREQLFGKAWLMIVGEKQKAEGLNIMAQLDAEGFIEATVAYAMFAGNAQKREQLLKKAADAGNTEALWQYSYYIPHSYIPNPNNPDDRKWEEYCLKAAEGGSVDAMNEMGNIFNRRENFHESMYWYAMANANDHHSGQISMRGIAMKWMSAGKPSEFKKGSPKFDKARFTCAQAYLEMNSGMELTVGVNEVIDLVLAGTPIAGYLAGDIFESIGNDDMAYKMYNALSFENDPHGLKCYADMLFAGKGVERDQRSAIAMYMKAAELGERSAMFILGELYRNSDKLLAAYWYSMSHMRGYELALDRMMQLV